MAYEPGKLIGVVEKNRVQEIRDRLVKLREDTFVDVRVFTAVGAGNERMPTKRGMTFKPELVPGLIEVLLKFAREALLKPTREANAAGVMAEQVQGMAVSAEAPVAAMACMHET